MYVVAIDASKDNIEATDYKAFESCEDAKDRLYRAWAMILHGKPVFEPGRPVHLYAARLYEVDASDPFKATAMVQRGLGTLVIDTDADAPVDLEELLPGFLAD
jgi:hypothetical protein